MQAFFRYQKLTLLWALFVLLLCCMRMNAETAKSHLFFPGFDKLVHCGFFFVFTTLACHGIIRRRGTLSLLNALSMAVLSVAFGAVIELLQKYFFTWRDGNYGDLFADTVGTGMAVFAILVTYFASRHDS